MRSRVLHTRRFRVPNPSSCTRPAPASAGLPRSRPGAHQMTLSVGHLSPVISLIAGILILIMPRLLNYIVAIYLIIIGVIGLGLIR